MTDLTGIVLAAGSGSRMGRPKALMLTPDGVSWTARAVEFLRGAGCDRVLVVLGAGAVEASPLVPSEAEIVVANDWERGMSASLRAGLLAASGGAALIMLVDLPGLPPTVGRRVVAAAGEGLGSALARAVFSGRPGHPVLIGSEHWGPLAETLEGDQGAQRYLLANGALQVECGDLSDGRDIDS